MFELDPRDFAALHAHAARILERGPAVDHLNVPLLRQRIHAAAQLVDHRFLPAAELGHIDLRVGETDAEILSLAAVLNQMCDVQQRFGRNATFAQAYAAQHRVVIDQRGLNIEIGGFERGDIPAGAAADDEKVRFLCQFADDHKSLPMGSKCAANPPQTRLRVLRGATRIVKQ